MLFQAGYANLPGTQGGISGLPRGLGGKLHFKLHPNFRAGLAGAGTLEALEARVRELEAGPDPDA